MPGRIHHAGLAVHVIVTEHGLADLRGLAPRRRAQLVIDHCADPRYRPMLTDHVQRAQAGAYGRHTPHLLAEALSWHARYVETGSMLP